MSLDDSIVVQYRALLSLQLPRNESEGERVRYQEAYMATLAKLAEVTLNEAEWENAVKQWLDRTWADDLSVTYSETFWDFLRWAYGVIDKSPPTVSHNGI